MGKNDETPKLDLTKPMRLRNGEEVRILCTDGPGDEPIAGFYKGDLMRWSREGFYWGSKSPCTMDLVNVPEKRTVWVYDLGEFSSPQVRIERDAILDNDCRSCIRVEFESGRKDK